MVEDKHLGPKTGGEDVETKAIESLTWLTNHQVEEEITTPEGLSVDVDEDISVETTINLIIGSIFNPGYFHPLVITLNLLYLIS